MKIILIKPPISPKEEFGDLHEMGSCEPPLGLCYLAANLRENNIEVEIIDSIALKLTFEEVVERVIRSDVLFVGFSAETPTIFNAAQLAQKIKDKRVKITTIIGGPHITALPEKTMTLFPQFDFGVIGEGENTLVELLCCLNNGEEATAVSGLIIKTAGKMVRTNRREVKKCLDSLPMPAWDLLPPLKEHYHLSFYSVKKGPSISIVTSRGCGYRCTFCYQGVFGKTVRIHSAAYIMNMIRELYYTYGIREIRFQDDIFLVNEKRLITLCTMLIEEAMDISWSCLSRVDSIKKEMLEMMKMAGCWQILLGIESGSQKILDDIKKDISLKQIERTLTVIRTVGIRTVGYFMIGYPSETKKTIDETIKFAKKLPINDFRMTYLVPFPETEMHSTASYTGNLSQKWNDMNFFKGPCYVPEKLTRSEIVYYRRIAFILFYFRPRILLSYMLMLQRKPSCIIFFLKGGWMFIKHLMRVYPAMRFFLNNDD